MTQTGASRSLAHWAGLLALALVFASQSGCGAAALPVEEDLAGGNAALIRAGTGDTEVHLVSVDSRPVGRMVIRIVVGPGPHTVAVLIDRCRYLCLKRFVALAKVAFAAEVGREYVIEAALNESGSADVWVLDQATQTVVGGRRPEPR